MISYKVLARKYRPQLFLEVVDQETIVTTLKNSIRMQRVAHAYLFCGCRGTGKTTLARLFAKAINCVNLQEEIEPCNACPSCREITASHSLDVLEIDGASHRGIEDIRQINETIGFLGKGYKIYIIDEVHMLTKEAFNALLKTLEEPPVHVKFLFCTTEPHKIPATILSRCQRFNLRRISSEKMTIKLAEIGALGGIEISKEALEMIAEISEGSLRDALSLLDQIAAFEKGCITAPTVTNMLGLTSREMFFPLALAGEKSDFSMVFKMTQEVYASGKNIAYFLEELTAHFRTLLLLKNGIAPAERHRKHYQEIATHYRTEQLVQILEFLIEGQQAIKSAPSERTALEMLLLKIVRSHQHLSLESLVQRLISLEQRFSISEDPSPKMEELPTDPPPSLMTQPTSVAEQSRFDTIMRFAAKELNGSLKTERNK